MDTNIQHINQILYESTKKPKQDCLYVAEPVIPVVIIVVMLLHYPFSAMNNKPTSMVMLDLARKNQTKV